MIKRPLLWIALAYLLGCLLYQLKWIVVGGILFFLIIILNLIFTLSIRSKHNSKTNATRLISKMKLHKSCLKVQKGTNLVVDKLKERLTLTKEDRFLLLIPVIILAGYIRMNMQVSPTVLDKYFERSMEVSLEGTINRVTLKDETISYYLSNVIIYPNQDESIPIKQKVIAYVKTAPVANVMQIEETKQVEETKQPEETMQTDQTYLIGNRIRIQGKLMKLVNATNEGQFDAYQYYLSQNVRYQIFVTSHSLIKDTKSWYANQLMTLRKRIAEVYDEILPKDSAGIMKAMLLGMNSELTDEVKSMYQKNGIAHILAISGLHISFIGLFLYKILKKIGCPIPLNCLIVTIFIFSYGKMTNFSVSTNRAVVMLLVSLGGIMLGRTYDMLSSLSLSVCIIITQSPMQIYNAGFQLSFAAVLALASIVSRINELEFVQEKVQNTESLRNRMIRKWKVMRAKYQTHKAVYGAIGVKRLRREVKVIIINRIDDFIYTLQNKHKTGEHRVLNMNIIITSTTLPIIARNYMEIPIYSIVLNLLVVPLSSALILLGLLGGLIGLISIDIAKMIAGIINLILSLYQIFCSFFSSLPFHLILTGKPSIYQVILYYVLFLTVIGVIIYTKRRKWIYLIVFLWIILLRIPSTNLQITMLDVSQGDSIYIKTPQNTHILIDGGSSDVKKIGQYRIEPYLKSQRIYQLDYAVLTHMDSDHINGIMELLEKMKDKVDGSNFRENRSIGNHEVENHEVENYKVENYKVENQKVINLNGEAQINESSAQNSKTIRSQGWKDRLLLKADYDGIININTIILPETNLVDDTYLKIEQLARQKGVHIIYFGTGDFIEEGEVKITCLHPNYEYITDSKNDASIVLEIRYRNFAALFLGDLESAGEHELIKNQNMLVYSYQLIKVGHHGSKYSTSEEFLARVQAQYALISSGYDNRYGHPHKEVIERLDSYGVTYYTTIQQGAIVVKTNGWKIWWGENGL